MANMYSVGELIDKLIIENIKIYRLRESLHTDKLSETDYVDTDAKMMIVNANRSTIVKFLDDKIKDVANGKPNSYFQDIKTYATSKKKDNK